MRSKPVSVLLWLRTGEFSIQLSHQSCFGVAGIRAFFLYCPISKQTRKRLVCWFCCLLIYSRSREYRRSSATRGQCQGIRAMRIEKPLEELYNVRVERNVSKERLTELDISKWSMWKTGKCKLPWDWHVDQLVYIEEGEVRVVPEGSQRYMQFVAGDLVRYPKWFEADLWFNGFYQERYSFRAYGDD
ncbi:unnamed protein product [Fraxinus pennsylvanica]|uniref:(S)-ureidoglycine aminohydrolase cupin domain-containing protein n=1 Tax=Fraxinus pennsylvanica TaxID=56036 RepID=A0AAD1Z081_9LAMI|nr:unnamed protein product [Fraxinus pennsylvanica]